MPWLLNALYLLGFLAAAPWLLYKACTTGKYRRGMLRKLFGLAAYCESDKACAWFHGVSVGEIHLLQPLVARFRQRHPDWDCVISTTTDTGYDEACKRFPDLVVFFWPLDFTWAVRQALRSVNPSLIILAECELWPNFLATAHQRGIPVLVVNGRMSPRSLRRWRQIVGVNGAGQSSPLWLLCLTGALRPFVGNMLHHVTNWCVQTEEYAAGFRELGVSAQRIHVTGSIKYDGVQGQRANPRTAELRRVLGIEPGDLVWIAGSTQEPEESIACDIFCQLREFYPQLRLLVVPRQKDRFDAVAQLLELSGLPFVRRSRLQESLTDRAAVVLVDTIGELSALWGLADVAFVGGSLDGKRGGQNMIEPAAYGAAVIFGPHVWNFRDTAERLLRAGAAVQVAGAASLETVVRRLLSDAAERERMGRSAQRLVAEQQGATERTLDVIDQQLHGLGSTSQTAEKAA